MFDSKEYSIVYPGRIVSYDSDTQLATVKISAERPFASQTETDGLEIRVDIQYVPVHTLSGGGFSLTMPIKTGDTCLLVFSQIGYDHWLWKDQDKAGKVANLPAPELNRMFSQDDGFCIVGFNTVPRKILNVSTTATEWRNIDNTQVIRLNDDGSIEVDTSTESMVLNADGTMDITSPIINLNGDVNISGITTGTGIGTFQGIGVVSHLHTNPEGGNVGPAMG